MSIADDIKGNGVILFTTSKDRYNESLGNLQPELANSVNKAGYVAVNKPFNSVMQDMKNKNIDTGKFFFIDAITATVQSPPAVDNCIFVTSPTALTDIGLAFSSSLSEHGCDLVFFDTISTLIVYQEIGSVIKFVHNLITKVRVLNKKLVLLALKEDSENLIKDLNMFVDKIIEI